MNPHGHRLEPPWVWSRHGKLGSVRGHAAPWVRPAGHCGASRASEPERLQRVPKYRPTLADPYRDYLRKRRAEEPGVPVQQLLGEIRERGYQGSSNLLVRYIKQGRLEGGRPHLSPRQAARIRILLTRPDRLRPASKRRSPASKAPARR